MKILFLSRWFPFPPNNGAKIRIASLVQALCSNHEVTYIGFSDDPQKDWESHEIHSLCKEVYLFPWKPYNPGSLQSLAAFFHPRPRFLVDTFSKELADQIETSIACSDFDVVIASQIDMAAYAKHFSTVPAVLEELESGLFYNTGTGKKPGTFLHQFRNGLTRYKRKKFLSDVFKNFRLVTVVSEIEKGILLKNYPDLENISVVPNSINLQYYSHISRTPVPNTIIYTGSFTYSANHDAMVWFISEVLPKIRLQISDVTLTITGDHANKPLPSLQNVNLTGYVDDIKSLISMNWCSIVPLRIGGGTRLKILEAMALGTPVVATSKGAEGLDVKDGIHLLIADTPEEFSNAVICLFKDEALRDRITNNAIRVVQEKYDSNVVMSKFIQQLHDLVSS